MSQNHLSRLAAPKSWPIKRKGIKWIARPRTGSHSLDNCITINVILKNILKHANTTREVKNILHDSKVLVNNTPIMDHKFAVGIMDIVSIPTIDQYYLVLLNKKNKFILRKINQKESLLKLMKIVNKTPLENKKIQINFYDGRNKIVDKDGYKVGDTLVMDLQKNEVKYHLKLEKSASIYLAGGKHVGIIGTLDQIKSSKDNTPNKIILKHEDKTIETLKKYAFVVNDLIKENERNERN